MEAVDVKDKIKEKANKIQRILILVLLSKLY